METNPQTTIESQPAPSKIKSSEGLELAYRYFEGSKNQPTLVFLPGYRSDMDGSKALFLWNWAKNNNISMLRLDYSGHGGSEGDFEDGTIGQWTKDAIFIIDQITQGPLIVVGSSMGGWIGLLVATKRPDRVKAYLGIAAAPDFTKWVWEEELTDEQRGRCKRDGKLLEDSPYSDEPDVMTYALFEDGKNHLLLEEQIPFGNPVILLHGKADTEVPWKIAEKIKSRLKQNQCTIHYIEDGEHRLSRESDLKLLETEIRKLYNL
ncbi:MAG: alpha/beta hydrolase [Pseudobdellovibrionaceae bacterium]|jgi:pimeloyl-ACP methyl ester carboxylesterase|nr:alpha/beta hydrolase [Pseudobdellovibrionaceae bacterium]